MSKTLKYNVNHCFNLLSCFTKIYIFNVLCSGRNRQTGGQGGAGSSWGHGRWSSWPWPHPSARPLQPGPFYPPKKNPWGRYWGIRSPLGLSSGTGGLHWAGLEAEASTGHDEESGAPTGSLNNRFHFCAKEADESPWTTPTRQDKTRLKLFLRTGQDLKRHSWPDMWTGSTGTCSGLESAAAGGLESAACLPHELQVGLPHERQAGLDWAADSSGDFPTNGGLEGAADGGANFPTTGGLEGTADGGGLEGLAANGLVAIPPNSHANLQWAMVG